MLEKIADRMEGISPFYVMELLQRAKELEKQGKDIVHMEIGEPDFPTPEGIVKAGINHIQSGQVKYTPAAGLPQLREKISQFYLNRYSVFVEKERIFITPGASGAFLLAFGASLNPGEEVLLADPGYPCNCNFIKLLGGKPRLIPVNEQSDFQLNGKLIDQHWAKHTKGALVASPSNPTGTIITGNDLHQSIDVVDRRGGQFYSDEIYHGLVYSREAVSALQYSDQVFVINSFSKYFAMTGWRIGWLIAPEKFCGAIEKLAQNIFISTSSHSQYAALAAFDGNILEQLESRRDEFSSRGDYLYQELQRLGFDVAVKPEGAFYIYANCSRLTDDSFQFAKELLETEGVAVTPGKDFGRNQPEKYLRFAYTTSMDRLQEGVSRLERFINRKR